MKGRWVHADVEQRDVDGSRGAEVDFCSLEHVGAFLVERQLPEMWNADSDGNLLFNLAGAALLVALLALLVIGLWTVARWFF